MAKNLTVRIGSTTTSGDNVKSVKFKNRSTSAQTDISSVVKSGVSYWDASTQAYPKSGVTVVKGYNGRNGTIDLDNFKVSTTNGGISSMLYVDISAIVGNYKTLTVEYTHTGTSTNSVRGVWLSNDNYFASTDNRGKSPRWVLPNSSYDYGQYISRDYRRTSEKNATVKKSFAIDSTVKYVCIGCADYYGNTTSGEEISIQINKITLS